jgi:hypothetical protein
MAVALLQRPQLLILDEVIYKEKYLFIFFMHNYMKLCTFFSI